MSWKIYALLAALFASLTAIFSKMGVRDINTDLATAIRVGFILSLVWGIAIVNGSLKDLRTLDLYAVVFLFLSASATGLSWLFYFRALEHGDVAKVAPMDKLSVAFSIILAAILLGEPITLKTALGGILIVAGSIILLL